MVEQQHRICYLNFDHSVLDPNEKASIIGAMAIQLSWQVDPPTAESSRGSLRRRRISFVPGTVSVPRHRGRSSSRGETWTSLLDAIVRRNWQWSGHDRVRARSRRRSDRIGICTHSGGLLKRALEKRDWHVVASGRADAPDLDAHRTWLEGFTTDDAIDLLDDLLRAVPDDTAVELSAAQLNEVISLVTTSPLCIRLASGILRYASDDEELLRDLELHRGMSRASSIGGCSDTFVTMMCGGLPTLV